MVKKTSINFVIKRHLIFKYLIKKTLTEKNKNWSINSRKHSNAHSNPKCQDKRGKWPRITQKDKLGIVLSLTRSGKHCTRKKIIKSRRAKIHALVWLLFKKLCNLKAMLRYLSVGCHHCAVSGLTDKNHHCMGSSSDNNN